mmetsp:Transcript_19412/g.18517  ORF Transcript_19412/g.18517 Transcript_19412/m.18517 type:complete len:201 (+) Transcript_19412:413-1015(+)
MMDNFGYFDEDFKEQFLNPQYMETLVSEILNDFISKTNQAIMVSNFHLCQKIKHYLVHNHTDFNEVWREVGLDFHEQEEITQEEQLKYLLLGQIPIIDQCNLKECSRKLQEVAFLQSNLALDYLQEEVGFYDDLLIDPDQLSLETSEYQSYVQNGFDFTDELTVLNDMALNGNPNAGLSLFNLYYQGNAEVGINRDVNAA